MMLSGEVLENMFNYDILLSNKLPRISHSRTFPIGTYRFVYFCILRRKFIEGISLRHFSGMPFILAQQQLQQL